MRQKLEMPDWHLKLCHSANSAGSVLKVFSETLDKPGPILSLKLMFPHADHGPAAFPQGGIYAAIAGLVGGDLVSPELRVGLGLGRVPGAAVPEAAVYKHRGLQFLENEVGSD